MTNASTSASLRSELAAAPRADSSARDAIDARIADILRPAGAFARLDAVASHLAAWQRTANPDVARATALIFAADHGVAREGVSAYPTEVTGAMLQAFEAHQATVSALAEVAGVSVTAIDVGVGRPTGNLRVEPALSPERFEACFSRGRESVRALDADLVILGEMGIGNTTAAAAVAAAFLNADLEKVVGRGTGVDDEGLERKRSVVSDAIARIEDTTDPLEVLREVGGAELVAIAGAMTEARMRSIPVLLDGFIASVPSLALHAIDPELTSHLLAGHASAEPGHRAVLDRLGLQPLLTLDLRLGEASGAVAAVPLVRMACRAVTNVPTFAEWFGAADG